MIQKRKGNQLKLSIFGMYPPLHFPEEVKVIYL